MSLLYLATCKIIFWIGVWSERWIELWIGLQHSNPHAKPKYGVECCKEYTLLTPEILRDWSADCTLKFSVDWSVDCTPTSRSDQMPQVITDKISGYKKAV